MKIKKWVLILIVVVILVLIVFILAHRGNENKVQINKFEIKK